MRRAIWLSCLVWMASVNLEAQQRDASGDKVLNWSPPNVDTPLPLLLAEPPCDVTKVLKDVSEELVSREYRSPREGHAFPEIGQDTGQVALGLIFRPQMQTDYEMNCEGLDQWKGQKAWIIRFQQRKDKPRRTMQIHYQGGEIGVMLKGRAWIGMGKRAGAALGNKSHARRSGFGTATRSDDCGLCTGRDSIAEIAIMVTTRAGRILGVWNVSRHPV